MGKRGGGMNWDIKTDIHTVETMDKMENYENLCTAQGTLLNTLWWPKWEGNPKKRGYMCISSVQFSRSVMSDSLRPHESQHARPPCPSPTPRVYSNSCPSSRWCHPAISSSVGPFSSCPLSLPASGSFPMSQLFAWGGQGIGVSASALTPPMNT